MMAVDETTTREQMRALVVRTIVEATDLAADEALLDQTLDELGIDSMTLVDVLFAVEDALGEEIVQEALDTVTAGGTLGQLIEVQLAADPSKAAAG